jgi:hypothetical protein
VTEIDKTKDGIDNIRYRETPQETIQLRVRRFAHFGFALRTASHKAAHFSGEVFGVGEELKVDCSATLPH